MTEELTKKLPFQVGETIYRIVRLRMQKKIQSLWMKIIF